MALHYDIWLLLISIIVISASIFIAFDIVSRIANTTNQRNNIKVASLTIVAGTAILANHLLILISTTQSAHLSLSWPLFNTWFCATLIAFCLITVFSKQHPKPKHFIIVSLYGGVCSFSALYTSAIASYGSRDIPIDIVMAVIATSVASVAMSLMSMISYWLKAYSGKNSTAIKITLAVIMALSILSTHFIFYTVFSGSMLSTSPDNLKVSSVAITLGLLSLLMMVFMFFLLYERYGKNVFKLVGAFRPTPAKNDLNDPLTKLPNRRAFESHLRAAEMRCIRNNNVFAVAYIDLDAFKPINDTHGHHIGDTVLSMTADRLNKAIRACDFVARIGGDEFVAILEKVDSEDDIHPVVTRIVTSIKEPYLIDHLKVELSCSVGIAIYPKDNQENKLLVNADAAMYKAKEEGKNQYKFYDEEIESANALMQNLQQDLISAVKNKEFSIVYMPKISCKTMTAVGAEALIRWDHPTKGEILPNDFLSIAEQCGLIKAINSWVVEECCRTIVRAGEADLDLNISVNLSSCQFRDANLVQQIVETIKNYELHPNRLAFEIKETAAVNNQKQFKLLLTTFKEAGIKVMLDDFGLLPVSLTYLLDLDIDEIKIDKSFIAMIHQNKNDKALIDAIFKLAHALGFYVTAEGIEDKAQQDTIIQLGCDFMQGYLFTKPVKEYDLLVLYKKLQYKQLQIDFDPPIPESNGT